MFRVESHSTLSSGQGRKVAVLHLSANWRGLALAVPAQAVLLVAVVHGVAKQLAQGLEIHPAFGDRIWEQAGKLPDVGRNQVGRAALWVFGSDSLHLRGDPIPSAVSVSSGATGSLLRGRQYAWADLGLSN